MKLVDFNGTMVSLSEIASYGVRQTRLMSTVGFFFGFFTLAIWAISVYKFANDGFEVKMFAFSFLLMPAVAAYWIYLARGFVVAATLKSGAVVISKEFKKEEWAKDFADTVRKLMDQAAKA